MIQSRGPTTQAVFSHIAWQRVADSLRLSPRELQIVKCVFDDLKEASIARQLGLSQSSVHTYLRRVYSKCGVDSRVALVLRIFAERQALDGD